MADVTRKTPPGDPAPLAEDLKSEQVEKVIESQRKIQALDEQPHRRTAKERDEIEEKKKDAKPSADELRAALEARSEQISRRVGAIQDEVARVPGEVGEAIVRSPLVSIGVTLAAGLAVGLLIGGIGRKKSKVPMAHQALVDNYLDALADDARVLIKKGEDVGTALRRAMGKHTPIVVAGPGYDSGKSGGFVRNTLGMALNAALGFASKAAMDQVLTMSGLAGRSSDRS